MSDKYPIGVIPLPADEGGGYLGIAADLPGCMSHGDTPEEALQGAQKAILEWLDEAKDQGFAPPAPGAAAAKFREDRANLVAQLIGQRQAFDKLDSEVRILRANMEALLAETRDPEDRQPTWLASAAIYGAGKKKEHNFQ